MDFKSCRMVRIPELFLLVKYLHLCEHVLATRGRKNEKYRSTRKIPLKSSILRLEKKTKTTTQGWEREKGKRKLVVYPALAAKSRKILGMSGTRRREKQAHLDAQLRGERACHYLNVTCPNISEFGSRKDSTDGNAKAPTTFTFFGF